MGNSSLGTFSPPFVLEVNRLFPINVYDNVASGEGKTPAFWRIPIFHIEIFGEVVFSILIMMVSNSYTARAGFGLSSSRCLLSSVSS